MDRATRARIDSLVTEIRRLSERGVELDFEGLARRFQLDPLIVQRVVEAEGLVVEQTAELDEEVTDSVQRRRVTAVLDLKALDAARIAAGGGSED